MVGSSVRPSWCTAGRVSNSCCAQWLSQRRSRVSNFGFWRSRRPSIVLPPCRLPTNPAHVADSYILSCACDALFVQVAIIAAKSRGNPPLPSKIVTLSFRIFLRSAGCERGDSGSSLVSMRGAHYMGPHLRVLSVTLWSLPCHALPPQGRSGCPVKAHRWSKWTSSS